MLSKDIRNKFIEFFKQHGHQYFQSAPIIPHNDPSILFTNAGMVPFKDVFLGKKQLEQDCAVSVQNCVRAGGKHNDLENVGYTKRHHTFFEMLGNFSFGGYFKQKAIQLAFTFLTKELSIPVSKLHISVYKDDDESYNIWHQDIGIPKEKISRCDEDNFWQMGPTGPCGPCTEIFYDYGDSVSGGPPGSENQDGDRFVEVWNIVFMEYEKQADGSMLELPVKCVDTGMGLDRIATVLQGKTDNYDNDVFVQIINSIKQQVNSNVENHIAFKVIADHMRAVCFLGAEGVYASNEGQGYVVRRILRRAKRFGLALMAKDAFLYKIVDCIVKIYGKINPLLEQNAEIIKAQVKAEEEQFAKTLQLGLKHLEAYKSANISGEFAFKLYDTFGFPIDILLDYAKEHDYKVDVKEFKHLLKEQKLKAKNARKATHNTLLYFDNVPKTKFLGYTKANCSAKVLSIDEAKQYVILDETVFYPNGGGQVGDTGEIKSANASFKVTDTQKVNEVIVHYGEFTNGSFKPYDVVEANINKELRALTTKNHTATHILHATLQNILGQEVQQRGSLVNSDKLRFDFSYKGTISEAQKNAIEAKINSIILQAHPVSYATMPLDDALKAGAIGLFEDKYKQDVKVVSINGISKELCGGTHINNTSAIGLFWIKSITNIANGVKRIEAYTFLKAIDALKHQQNLLEKAKKVLQTDEAEFLGSIDNLLAIKKEFKSVQKNMQHLRIKSLVASLKQKFQKCEIGEILIAKLEKFNIKELKEMTDGLIFPHAIVILVSLDNEKVQVVARCGLKINNLPLPLSEVVKRICGSGGGRLDLAQGGGAKPSDLDQILNLIKSKFK